MTTYKIAGYFTAPTSQLEALERERERIAGCADRNARHYADILREMDDQINALRAKQVKIDVPTVENAQAALYASSDAIGGGDV